MPDDSATRQRVREALLARLARDISDQRVLAAMAAVPRDLFVPPGLRHRAWDDTSLPIAYGQTISQPIVVARMCELLELRGDEAILDVGTGSGYHAAVLARLGRRVVSIERHRALSASAAGNLRAARVANVELVVGDGTLGHPPAAPYDAINVAAAGRGVPVALEDQLAAGGRLVMPSEEERRLLRVRREERGLTRERLDPVRFVPLIGSGASRRE